MKLIGQSLARKTTIVFTLFALVMLSAIVTVLYFQQGSNKVDGVRIDIAGRNRMLSQKAMLKLLLINSDNEIGHHKESKELKEILELHQSSFLLLKHGGNIDNIAIDQGYEDFREEFDEISAKWIQYNKRIGEVLKGEESGLVGLSTIAQELLEANNKLVQALVHQYNERNKNYRNIFLTQGFLSLMLLLFGILLVRGSIVNPATSIMQYIKRLNQGHFGDAIQSKSQDEFGKISKGLNKLSGKINALISSLKNLSANVLRHCENLELNADSTSESAATQAASMEEIHASLEELNGSAELNAELSSSIKTKTNRFLADMEDLRVNGETYVGTLNEVNERVRVIEELASQTNLLALNAAVEASRAGENGKGFSVTSREIRQLADSSKEASEEIMSLLQDCKKYSDTTIALIDTQVKDFHGFLEDVESIDNASAEQNHGIEQINQTITMLNQVSQSNAQVSKDLNDAFIELRKMAKEMNLHVSSLTNKN